MRLLPHERPKRLADYSDAELDAMTWIELAELSPLTPEALSRRVRKWGVSRREAVQLPRPAPPRSTLRRKADAANLNVEMVRARVRRNGGDLDEALSYPPRTTWSRRKRDTA